MDGGRLRRPPLINYQFYIKKVIKIHGKTCKGYVKICKKYTKKKFMHRKFMYFFRSLNFPTSWRQAEPKLAAICGSIIANFGQKKR